jgi:RNA 2',3'-cyclic 3'-phosphodiesterase
LTAGASARPEERARLFVALGIPLEVQERLAEWARSALPGGEGVRHVSPPNLHVTLCFLGGRRRDDLRLIAEACAVIRGRGAIELHGGEAVALPRRRPRVLAVSLEDSGGALAAVQAALSEALHAGGFYEPEERPFYGHVTVARAGRHARIPRTALLAPPPPALRFRASQVVLYRSHLRRGGASYEPLERIELDSA